MYMTICGAAQPLSKCSGTSIHTFKNHFLSGLSSTNSHCPLQLWDQLMHQATTTLNILRTSRIDPTKLAYQQLQGGPISWPWQQTLMGTMWIGCMVLWAGARPLQKSTLLLSINEGILNIYVVWLIPTTLYATRFRAKWTRNSSVQGVNRLHWKTPTKGTKSPPTKAECDNKTDCDWKWTRSSEGAE